MPEPLRPHPQDALRSKDGGADGRADRAADLAGDDDPLDILVLTEKEVSHGNVLVQAIPIGGLGMLDGTDVDDKIVAVLAERRRVRGATRTSASFPQRFSTD